MGSILEFNDTLKIKSGLLPKELEAGKEYSFQLKDRRIFHLHPVRVFLVEERDGKWGYIGHAQIIEQTIDALTNTTSGRFVITKFYSKEYAELLNNNEPPDRTQHVDKETSN